MAEAKEDERLARLPHNVVPQHYDLHLQPDLQNKTFSGSVTIRCQVNEATSVVLLNANELEVQNASAGDLAAVEISETHQVLKLQFAEEIPVQNELILSIDFTGILNDKMVGFYASTYGENGEKTMATTQFESVYARQAFPCWDEPALKATFGVSLTVPKDLHCVSNMPCINEEDISDVLVKKTFDNTPIMSTYLLAFVVGEFDVIESQTADTNTVIRVFTPVGKAVQGEFALETAVKCLEYFNTYFEIVYPLPKLDLLAIPDFAFGAMENWGCVTYRSTALLVDPDNSSASSKQWVALVVAHELAHQWFGNLVTMEWWTHLWLNEGFATWVEYLAINYLFPEWKIWLQFVSQDLEMAMNLDALRNSHPVEVQVNHASEVDQIFDHISYAKGSCVIRMLVSFLGEEEFRKGMVVYLNRHKYQNTQTEDLWDALSDSSGKDVRGFMQVWTKQTGYPVVSVQRDGSKLSLTQTRFMADGSEGEGSWNIPIQLQTSNGPVVDLGVMNSPNLEINLDGNPAWVKLNLGQESLYRVTYSDDMIEALKNALIAGEIEDAADRLGLHSDAYALAKAGHLSTDSYLNLVSGFASERNYSVWKDIASCLSSLALLLGNTDLIEPFNQWRISLLEPVASEIGWGDDEKADDDHLTNLLRSLIIPQLGLAGHKQTVREACQRFVKFQASGYKDGLTPDLRAGVYGIVLKNAGAFGVESVLHLHDTTDLQEEKVRCLAVIGKAGAEYMDDIMELAFGHSIRAQDAMYVYRGFFMNPETAVLAYEATKGKWDFLQETFGDSSLLGRFASFTGYLTTHELADDVEGFFTPERRTPNTTRAIDQALEKIRANATWMDRDIQAICEFLASQ